MTQDHPILAILDKERRGQKNRPVIHVLMPDGRVTDFKDRGIVLPDSTDDDEGVFAVLINSNGDIFETADGVPAVVSVPVVGIEKYADPNEVVKGWGKIAAHLGVSIPTAKRMEEDGRLPRAYRPSERQVLYKRKQLDKYLDGQRR